MSAKPEPFWIARLAAGGAARLRNPDESVEDYRVAMGWDQPKPAAYAKSYGTENHTVRTMQAQLREALSFAEEVAQRRNVQLYAQDLAARAHSLIAELRAAGVTAAPVSVPAKAQP
jgi:hypothetical protein